MRQEKQEFLKKMKKEISEIKKEGKIEDIKIEPVKEKKSKKYSLKKGALIGATALALATTNVPIRTTNDGSKTLIEAEAAKKDKKKPVLKFKGKTKMVVQENESIKIPTTTAKDNKDGNVTKKIKVTVKKGKKKYAGIAKKIKNNKPVTFTDSGKYVITYTVSDKAGNKATKKRYITVTEGLTTTETVTTEAPVTRKAPARVQQMQTTEAPTTEEPTKKIPTDADYVDYGYEVITSKDLSDATENITINLENDFYFMYSDRNSSALKDYSFIKYFGKITATDSEGNDISDSVKIYIKNIDEYIDIYADFPIYILATDSKGNVSYITKYVYFTDCHTIDENAEIISSTTNFYGLLKKKIAYNNIKNNNKKLEYII